DEAKKLRWLSDEDAITWVHDVLQIDTADREPVYMELEYDCLSWRLKGTAQPRPAIKDGRYIWEGEFRVNIVELKGSLNCKNTTNIKSLETFPRVITGRLSLDASNIKSLKGVPHCKELELGTAPIKDIK